MTGVALVLHAIGWFAIAQSAVFAAVAVAGLVGALLAATTRADAFAAAGRQSNLVWAAILLGSSFVVITFVPFLSWLGIVAIGLYWFDVRPQIRDLLDGASNW